LKHPVNFDVAIPKGYDMFQKAIRRPARADQVFSLDINQKGFFWNAGYLNRMNNRASQIFSFDPLALQGARVLDIGARFGFWSWAAHQLGAAQTLGIEGRQESADRGAKLMQGLKHQFLIGNAFDLLPKLADVGQSFDVILNLGFYYHIYDHNSMFRMMDALAPRIIVIDSEMDDLDDPVVRIRKEKTWNPNNAIAEAPGQDFAAVGNPSRGTIELLAECYGYQTRWCDWSTVKDTTDCDDYIARTRFTCILTKA
jgi:2-polyprenyl-3-methyl-5-hydroxy-6-metoxy-1,4-benzoquinol methylase